MSERTQLQFVWFAGYFLKSLFDDMFENVRIEEDSIRRVSPWDPIIRKIRCSCYSIDPSCNSWQARCICASNEERY